MEESGCSRMLCDQAGMDTFEAWRPLCLSFFVAAKSATEWKMKSTAQAPARGTGSWSQKSNLRTAGFSNLQEKSSLSLELWGGSVGRFSWLDAQTRHKL